MNKEEMKAYLLEQAKALSHGSGENYQFTEANILELMVDIGLASAWDTEISKALLLFNE